MDFPDKSQTASEPPKKVQPVIPKGQAQEVKRPASRRFRDFLIAENPKDIAKNVGRNLVVPRLKAAVEEAFNAALAQLLWSNGNTRPTSGIVQGTVLNGGVQTYATPINGTNPALLAAQANTGRAPGGYQDLKFPSQQFAEAVLASMYQLHNDYRMVSVADLYESANMSNVIEPSDNKIGWYSLEGARIEQARDGYILALPRPIRL